MPSHPLNIFQRLTRQWDALHPYNAAQLMRLPGGFDASAIEASWRSALADLSLGNVTVRRGRYQYTPSEEREALVTVAPADTNLESYLTDEMNRPFDPGTGMPLRAFIVPSDRSYWFGVVYHHWIADSVSIRMLLRQWFCRHFDAEPLEKMPSPRPARYGYWRLFGPDARHWDMPSALLEIGRWSSRLRRVRRVESEQFPDMRIRFKLHHLPDGVASQLVGVARQVPATVNDLFLGAMAEACDRYVSAPTTSRRNDLALGVITDLRGSAPALANVFGLYLGFTNIICPARHLQDWSQLVQTIAEQGRQQRQSRVPESSMLRLMAGLAIGKILPRRKLLEFYRKRLPLSAGISNVNLNRTWVARYHPDPILEYIRVSPTGPMLPLVFTPSTLGKSMHFGLTHRAAVVPATVADACAFDFSDRLLSLLRREPKLRLPHREAS